MKFDFINIEYVVVAIGIAVLYLLYYMFIKEAQYTKKYPLYGNCHRRIKQRDILSQKAT